MNKLIIIAIFLLTACGPIVPVTNVAAVSPEQMLAASKIRIYTLEGGQTPPNVTEALGLIDAYSCKNMTWDPPASKSNALTQLRLKAVEMGADAIIDVTFDEQGTDALGTNCWQSFQASGTAVKVATSNHN